MGFRRMGRPGLLGTAARTAVVVSSKSGSTIETRSHLATFEQAGLVVAGKTDIRPTHPRASEQADPLRAARAAELTSLWRLKSR